MSSILEYIGQLSTISTRQKISQKIAKALGAETLLIFIKDEELQILLPAPGYKKTIPKQHEWQIFFATCMKSGEAEGRLHYPTNTTKKNALGLAYKDELIFLLLGGQPNKNMLHEIQQILPLLSSVLKSEQKQNEIKVRLDFAEKSLVSNREVMDKLYSARKELQKSVTQLHKETKARRSTEKELLKHRERLNDLFMQAPAAIAILKGPQHVFELANQQYHKLVGSRDVQGKTVRQAFPEVEGQGIFEILDKVYKTGKPFVGNEILVRLDRSGDGAAEGGYFNFVYKPIRNSKNKITGIFVHAVDVTEQVLTRIKVQASEERLRFMAESMPQKVFISRPNGDVDYLNPQWKEYAGLSLKEIKKWNWTKIIHPDDVEENVRRWKRSLKTGEPYQFEHRFRRHDGTYRLHLTRARAFKGNDGEIIMWVGSSTDIEDLTQTIDRKNELELINSKLKEQRKELVAINNTKDEFVALASHQLRTPATAVKQYISLVLTGVADPITPKQEQFLQTAYESNERQLEILNDLLKTAQLDSNRFKLRKEQCVISELINNSINDLQPLLTLKKQKVLLDSSEEPSPVLVDSHEMKLVISNLLENASKYSNPNSYITVKLFKNNRKLVIEITDTGVGIAQEHIHRIFDKFTRVDNELSDTVSGTGLGLYWVKQIIKLHGGTIQVNSELGKGSSFIVKIPL